MRRLCVGHLLGPVSLAVVCTVGFSLPGVPATAEEPGAAAGADSLVVNADFRQRSDSGAVADWAIWKPTITEAACRVQPDNLGVCLDAPGVPYAVGGLTQRIGGIEPGAAYRVRVWAIAEDIPYPEQSVLVRLAFTRGGRRLHPGGWLVTGCRVPPADAEGPPGAEPGASTARLAFDDVFTAPQQADSVELSLEVKWPRGGRVWFREARLDRAPPPEPRPVKVGTVFLRPQGNSPEQNLELFCQQVDAAGRLGLDIVCLGECITLVGTGKTHGDVAESIPGPSTDILGQAAERNHLWVVAGLVERAEGRIYNTAVLIDREGKLAGKYRKVHLPREEWQQGIAPGEEYPVFETDFGRVAIQICYDWFFPETATMWRLRGAEIVFAPTWGNTLRDQEGRAEGETIFRARARDGGIWLVPSVYDGNSLVIDPLGRILADSDGREGVFWAEVDLAERERLDWVGWWRAIYPRHRMLESYDDLDRRLPLAP